jgi:serine protease Do
LQGGSRRFPARLRGEAPETDLAVIRLPVQEPITYMNFGDSDKVQEGDRVVSIGYGSERNQIVERGIIMSLSRSGGMDPYNLSDLIRFNLPVHPDNTGGPLCNLQGEIIGINSALMTRLSGVEGAGFAIPGNVAKRVAKKLIKNGRMNRGWLGITVQGVTLHTAGPGNPLKTQGVLVTHVVKGGPADRAGMKTGDVITFYGDRKVPSAERLRREVAGSPAGEKVSLTIVRNKHEVLLSVVIGNPEASIRDPAIFIRNRLGADVRPVTTREADQYDLNSGQGVVITELYPGSLLREAGFETNDIIIEVEGRPVKNLMHFMEQIVGPRHRRRVIMLGLDHRTGRIGFVQVEVP